MANTFGARFCNRVLFSLFLVYSTFHCLVADEIVKTGTDEGINDIFNFKVNLKRLKREVRAVPKEEEAPLEGRTHRASDPLDPNKSVPSVNPFEDFETVNTIFEPTVEGEDGDGVDEIADKPQNYEESTTIAGAYSTGDNETGFVSNENDISREDNDNADADNNIDNDVGDAFSDGNDNEREYAAQYPYPQTSSRQYEADDGSQRRFYPGDLDQPLYQRGVVEPYRNPQSREGSRQYSSGSVSQNVTGGSRVYSQQTFNVGESGNVTSRYQPGTRRYPDNSRARPETRRPEYDGQVYVDSQGHYVDAQGRHLDPTGRYYDNTGVYQDALVTRTNYYGSRPAYTHSSRDAVAQNSQYLGSRTPNRGARLDSYGGNQFYQTGSGSYPVSYDPVVSQISDSPNCADMDVQVTINGLPCNNAVSQIGTFVCYNYERVSTECCRRCLAVKRRDRDGCEYGDRSNQCRTIQPNNCYDDRNRQICCDRCRQFLDQRGQGASIYQSREQLVSRCSFDDLTPRCSNVRQRSYLCYLPENQRLCCHTCPRLANSDEPSCQWGDQSPELCEPFDANRRLKLNCYIEAVRNICCATCKSLRERMPQRIAGCEYGDAPTLFRTGRGLLNCGEFIRQYGSAQCNSHQTSTKCCYTCQRFRSRRQGR